VEITRRNFLKLVGTTIIAPTALIKTDAADIIWNPPKLLTITDIFIYDIHGTYIRFSSDLMVMLRIDP